MVHFQEWRNMNSVSFASRMLIDQGNFQHLEKREVCLSTRPVTFSLYLVIKYTETVNILILDDHR